MDEIVKQALAKWPNVPHCYGWLALDARGGWRMRNERAQAQGLLGERINNAALLAFINRNYMHDDLGRWYFQNGPQRVYVNLEATPYIAHTGHDEAQQDLVLHTGETLAGIERVWLTDAGRLILQSAEKVAMVDDRDLAQCLTRLHVGHRLASEEDLLEWLSNQPNAENLSFDVEGKVLPVERLACEQLTQHFGFVAMPQPDNS